MEGLFETFWNSSYYFCKQNKKMIISCTFIIYIYTKHMYTVQCPGFPSFLLFQYCMLRTHMTWYRAAGIRTKSHKKCHCHKKIYCAVCIIQLYIYFNNLLCLQDSNCITNNIEQHRHTHTHTMVWRQNLVSLGYRGQGNISSLSFVALQLPWAPRNLGLIA